MARAENTELIDAFEEFYRDYYHNEIGALAQKYPSEEKSLFVDWDDLYRFDPDMADDYRTKPEQMQEYAEEALRLYDLPIDVKLGQAHVRVTNLPETTEIREIRADHRGQLLGVQGIVRKATEVRPKITRAAFECQRCGTLTRIPQSAGDFQEPHECQGCERQGPFRINFDQSEFVDAQKIRVQESPEGLRGGETPQSIDVNIEDDITGEVTAGDHVRITGVLKLDQRGNDREKSPMFDVYMDGVDVEIEDEQFEEMEITDRDKREIIALSEEEDLYEKMVGAIAPSIYGYDEEKLAMILQLFSGVTKHLPDDSRIRGDLHMLLIGDPGTGKCVKGDTVVTLADGTEIPIGDLVEANLDDPKPIDDGVWDTVDIEVPSLQEDGSVGIERATKVWKREAPDTMYRLRTASGREIEVTPSHPLFVQSGGEITPATPDELDKEDFIAVPRSLPNTTDDTLDVCYRESKSPNAVRLDLPERWTPSLARLIGYIVGEGYVQRREDNTGYVSITNNDSAILQDVDKALDRLGINFFERSSHEGKSAREIVSASGEFVSFLSHLEPALLERSAEQRVPQDIKRGSPAIKRAFLRAYVDSECHVSETEREITVSSTSRDLLTDVRTLLLSFGIESSIQSRENGSFRLRVSGLNFERYIDCIGFITERKVTAAATHEGTPTNTNTDIVPDLGQTLRQIREALKLSQSDCGLPRTTYQHYERGDRHPSRESLQAVLTAFEDRLDWLRDTKQRLKNGDWRDVAAVRAELDVSQADLSESTDVTQTAMSYYERKEVVPDGGTVQQAKEVLLDRIEEGLAVSDTVSTIRDLAEAGVRWDRIESIEPVAPDYQWVYDLEVAGTHNYVTDTIFSHNSQLLSYIQNIAPRSVYTSGKGSSSAGLCVTGDTLIHTADGIREIGDLVKSDLPEPVDTETSVQRSVEVQTFDREVGEMTDAASSHAWRMPEKPCRRIETSYGKELEASVNTPVLTCGSDGIEWCEISEVEAGDYVAVPRFGDVDGAEIDVRQFLELTSEKVKLSEESVTFLREALCEEFGTLRDAAATLDLSEDFIYLHLKNRHVPLEKLDRMLDAVGATREDVRFDRLMLRHGDSVTVPDTFDEDLMYLLGLVFGDGDISLDRRGGNRGMVRISNSDERLLERAVDVFEEKFDKRPDIEYQDDKVPCIRVNSATVARLFSNAGMETPKDDLSLAPEFTVAEHADAFLRGLMDADGSVSVRGSSGGSSVLMSTISERLAEQVQLMLETYGVRARTRERDRRGTYDLDDGHTIESKHVQHFVELYGANIDRYAESIGFECAEKQRALEEVVREERRQREMIPVASTLAAVDGSAGQYYQNINRGDNPGRARARSMLEDIDLGPAEPLVREAVDADLRWDEVVAAVDTGEKGVFDLTVPGTHNFVGNGIVTHNTAAAVRDDFGDGQQWTLEAGALVLADQGIAAIDELDKMRCVAGDTLVHFGDRVARIGEFAREATTDGSIEELPNGRTIRDVDATAWTMADDGSLVRRPITAVHEYDAPEQLRRVTLETGERITATVDHPFFVFEDSERVEKPIADIDPGDWVYVPRRIHDRTADGGTVPAGTAIPTADQSAGADGVSPSFGAVLGYLAGDGNVYHDQSAGVYGIRFTNTEEELLADFERACREAFGGEPVRPPSERRADGVETVRLTGREHADAVLDAGMNLETYDGKRLPEAVTRSSRTTKAAFLRALADSEGSVDDRNVRLFSSSYDLLLGAKHLLLEFGISSQIQTRERDDGRDVYLLAVTDADSLAAFDRYIGFTLDRKQEALEGAVEAVTGTRTILDVVPDCEGLLAKTRDSLRLYQSECGINGVTYCNFETGEANLSFRKGRTILEAFEERKQSARDHRAELAEDASWETLEKLRTTYHVSQRELAATTEYTQPRVSAGWGEDERLRETVRSRLESIVADVEATDLRRLRDLVYGDVKWRRVECVEPVESEGQTDSARLYRKELADLLDCAVDDAVERARELLESEPETGGWKALRRTLEDHRIPQATLAADLDVDQSTLSRWSRGVVDTDGFSDVRVAASERIDDVRAEVRSLVDAIEESEQPKVYDLTVAGTHNFVANGMVVHNSEDRSAMHEALEQQQISVSKAGINATLKSRCSLLGAANPKYGRFDQYEAIGEQIDLEPALISRFDLIFTVTDEPDEERDRELAEHILTTNYAGELHTHRTESNSSNYSASEVETVTDEVAPTIEPELLRKYVAYAKRNCFPTMTDEAREEIKQFYADLRAEGQGEDAPVPVTARKLEALIRLAEASARVRLSDRVTAEDARRVIEIVRSCLEAIGVDPETGELDADVIESGTSKSQRDRIKNLKALIQDLEDEYDQGAPVDVVVERAEEAGMDASKAEHEIDKLKQKGEVYEPRTDHLRTT